MAGKPKDSSAKPGTDPNRRSTGISRRDFLTIAGATLSSTVLPASLTACTPGGVAGPAGPQPNFTTTLVRPTDLLSLKIGFVNLALSGDMLNPISASAPGYLQVDFGPQHVLEACFFEGVSAPPAEGTTIQHLAAGNTRVVFVVPPGQSLQYSVNALLQAFGTLQMNVPTLATPADGVLQPMAVKDTPVAKVRRQRFGASGKLKLLNSPGGGSGPNKALGNFFPAPPSSIETALEVPTRLMLAPNQYAGWAHSLTEVTSATSQRTELWHTRLGVRVGSVVDESDAHKSARTVRAFWTRDTGFKAGAAPPDPKGAWPDDTDWAAMRGIDRSDIVFESVSPRTAMGVSRTPQAIQVNRLMLTALGGWLDVRADFGESPLSGLAEWQQRTTMGRDHYIKLVRTGILYPFGHRAVMIWITERKLFGGAEALWQRAYVVVRQPSVTYDPGSDAALQSAMRQFPFKQVTVTTLSTPPLIAPGAAPGSGMPSPLPLDSVKPTLADGSNKFFAFKMVGIDHAGSEIHFESPALWVPTGPLKLATGKTQAQLDAEFAAMTPVSNLNAQRVAFAPEAPMAMAMAPPAKKPGGATYEAHSMTHVGTQTASWPSIVGGLPFLPNMKSASVAVEALRGLSANASDAVDIAYHAQFVANGFGSGGGMGAPNAGDLLFQLANASPVDFSAHSDSAGGFVNPNFAVTALSRALGPVSGDVETMGPNVGQAAADVANGTFDPDKFLALIGGLAKNAKIFGVFNLTDIISVKKLGQTLGLDKAPKFLTQALNDVETLVADAQQIVSLLQNIDTIATTVSMTAQAQVVTKLNTLKTTLDSLAMQATTLVTAIGDAVTDPANASTHVDAAVLALAQLPTQLGQIPTAIDALGADLPPQLINLTTVLKTVSSTLNQAIGGLASTFKTLLQAYVAGQDLVKNLAIKLDWQTPVQGFPGTTKKDYIFDPFGGFGLSAELRLKATQGKPAGLDLVCGLEKFDIHLFGGDSNFISIHFLHLQFVVQAGKKANVDVKLDKPGVTFEGPLSFVQTLTSIIPLDGFSDPPGIDVSPTGIKASFSIGLPTLAVGVMTLSNISIGAGFKIPFIGDPVSVNFDFCSRDNPFILTVDFLGGGGFFGIQLNPNGIELLEASFEAGAMIAVDFGVASGSLSAMIGIYFKMEFDATTSQTLATLTGFFRFRGEVDVLGIITASIELYLELTYESASGKVTGTATLDVDVSVFFIHVSVSITVRKSFGGGNSDPTFYEIMQPANANDLALPSPFNKVSLGYDPWQEYLNAFAA